jgi:hypothetical protein
MLKTVLKFSAVATVMLACMASSGLAQESMKMDAATSEERMTMHHMHMMINHAMEMAAEGSDLIMLGKMGMAPGIDDISVKHGRMMISDAKDLIKQVMSDKSMADMHAKGITTKSSPEMAFTHKLSAAAMAYITAVESMPP